MLHFRGGEVADFKKLMTTPQHLPLKLGTMMRLCTLLWSPYDEIRHPLFRTITVRGNDKVWTVTLAPPSRMSSRGATEKVVAIGENVSAYGYPSTIEKDEMRAERITVDGKTYEMR